MKIYRFLHSGRPAIGVADGDRIVRYDGDALQLGEPASDSIAIADAELLAPVSPSKIVAGLSGATPRDNSKNPMT